MKLVDEERLIYSSDKGLQVFVRLNGRLRRLLVAPAAHRGLKAQMVGVIDGIKVGAEMTGFAPLFLSFEDYIKALEEAADAGD